MRVAAQSAGLNPAPLNQPQRAALKKTWPLNVRSLVTLLAPMLWLLASACDQRLQSLEKMRPGDWMDDLAITREVQSRLAADPELAGKIRVETISRSVYLTGSVQSNELKQRAGYVALETPRVTKVANNLVVHASD